ncbi:MAG: gfo/Idh/MocA family oxidoreductase [Dehalococcoidia bacterium]|nr:gfo/Idh/MocA family oxidoreductase [Dehalococcoidia bacterium]
MRIGVVGFGYWGSKHARVMGGLPDVNVAIVDSDEDRRLSAAMTFPAATTFSNLDEALHCVDAVVIATPPRSHAPLIKQALLAGVHVLVEKPMATSTAEAAELVDLAERCGVVLMVGHTFEYNGAVWRLREMIDRGDLGRIFYIDSSRLSLGLYQSDVNVLWDLAPHDVSIANYLLGTTPTQVSAWGTAHASRDMVDVAHMRLDYESIGVTAYIHVSWLDPAKVRRITVAGSARMAVYDDTSADERIRVYDKGVEAEAGDQQHFPMTYRHGDIVSPYLSMEEPLLVEDRHFLACVRDGDLCNTPARSGYEVVRVIDAANLALETGGPVPLLDEAAATPPALPVG